MSENITKVVGGIIINKGKIFIAQRSNKKDHGLKWEFPGGKVNLNEIITDALAREMKEELSINIKKYKFLLDYIFEYKNLKKIHLHFYKIEDYIGIIKNLEHNKIIWTDLNNLEKFDFLDGDRIIIERILNSNILD